MKIAKRTVSIFLTVVIVLCTYVLSVNFYIIASAQKFILEEDEISSVSDVDYVLVLGCGVKPDGTPSHMLSQRVEAGVEVFQKSTAASLLLTGDKSGKSYDEPGVMKSLALEREVKEDDIITDNIGYSTYESIYNAVNIYGAKKIIIITQPYHLPRALYIARSLGLEAYGYEAYLPLYPKQIIWSLREVAARNKDFIKCAVENYHSETLTDVKS